MTLKLPEQPTLKDLQSYIHALEVDKGWQEQDMVTTAFFLGEELGELFKAIRYYNKMDHDPNRPVDDDLAGELADCLNYLLAIANRADIDLEKAFRDKNRKNEARTWIKTDAA